MCQPNTVSYVWINNELISIDSCIAPLIVQLNNFGIKTIASCCGHGKEYPYVMCEKGSLEKLIKFGCQIGIVDPKGLVHAFFPVNGVGKVYFRTLGVE